MNPKLIRQVMEELDATPERVRQLQRLPFEQACEQLEAMKVEARKRYKKLAFKHHPDRNQGNEAEAAEHFKALTAVLKDLESLQFRHRPPPPQVTVLRWASTSGTTATTTSWAGWPSTTTASAHPAYNATRVAFIKIF